MIQGGILCGDWCPIEVESDVICTSRPETFGESQHDLVEESTTQHVDTRRLPLRQRGRERGHATLQYTDTTRDDDTVAVDGCGGLVREDTSLWK